jgi:hypothetical protein
VVLLGLFKALEFLITQGVENPRDLSVDLPNPGQAPLVALVATHSLGKPTGHDLADIGELGSTLLAPRQIPRGMQLAPGASTPGVPTTPPHLIETALNHRKGTEHLLQKAVPLLVEPLDFLAQLACIQKKKTSAPYMICIYLINNQKSSKKEETLQLTPLLTSLRYKTPLIPDHLASLPR